MKTQQPNIDLKVTTSVETPEGNVIFQQGFIIRKVSKFVLTSDEDGYLPIPVFFDAKTNKILLNTLPEEIREEYKEYSF